MRPGRGNDEPSMQQDSFCVRMRQIGRIADVAEEATESRRQYRAYRRPTQRQRQDHCVAGGREQKIHMKADDKTAERMIALREPWVELAEVAEQGEEDRSDRDR